MVAGKSARWSSLPKYADSPSPPAKIVSARPETIWLARSVMVEQRVDGRQRRPRRAAAPTARQDHGVGAMDTLRGPVSHGGAESIIPSTPRLSTPERSASSSPRRRTGSASRRGPPGRARPRASCCSRYRAAPRTRPTASSRSREPQPVADQQLAAERTEQDDPLHDADKPRGKVWALEGEAGVLEPAEKQGDEAHGERVVAGECRDDDPRVAERSRPSPSGSSVYVKSPIWLAPPRPATPPEMP